MKGKSLFVYILLVLFMSSCEDNIEQDKVYNFIGDSIIARWPIGETFPSQLVYNYGKSGAGIEYLNNYCHSFDGQDVVVLIGTNDNHLFAEDNVDEYITNYLSLISMLTDENIYLFSVLPREFKNDSSTINYYISNINAGIKNNVSNYPNITYIDVYKEFMNNGQINYQYYSDGLHLNIYGYEILSSYLLRFIKNK